MNYKMKLRFALKAWLVIYPSITFFYLLFGHVLSRLPLYQRTFILTISLVPWMIFIGIPAVDALIRKLKQVRTAGRE